MKFYKVEILTDYLQNKITAVFNTINIINLRPLVKFIKNGMSHNYKNSAVIYSGGYKVFYLNGIRYGYHNNFTKHSWRKFTKLISFL